MTYEYHPIPGEMLLFHGVFQKSSNADPFGIAITDRSIYVPKKKIFAIKDPYYFEKWDKVDIVNCEIGTLKPIVLYTIGAALTLAGFFVTWMMFELLFTNGEGKLAVAPLFLIGLGLTIIFTAKHRKFITIQTHTKKFKWKYPVALSNDQKTTLGKMFTDIKSAIFSGGFTTTMMRDSPSQSLKGSGQ